MSYRDHERIKGVQILLSNELDEFTFVQRQAVALGIEQMERKRMTAAVAVVNRLEVMILPPARYDMALAVIVKVGR